MKCTCSSCNPFIVFHTSPEFIFRTGRNDSGKIEPAHLCTTGAHIYFLGSSQYQSRVILGMDQLQSLSSTR
ncbi:hypothetical protein XENTR_v10021018 [Xenopus tropicalis]|nr:hypothetical protein XENTR_v10021018 [Xenopus tropicalis]